MGEGLYHSQDGHTAYAEPYDGLDFDDPDLLGMAYDELVATIHDLLSGTWWSVDREWRGRNNRIIARNRLHEIWLTGDSYDRIHVTFGVRADLCETGALARHSMPDRAEAFFDRLQMTYPLRVRTTPWISAERMARAVAT